MLLSTAICRWTHRIGPYYPMLETQLRHTNDKSRAVADIQLDIQLKLNLLLYLISPTNS